MKNNIAEYNSLKRLSLITKLLKTEGKYRLICIDVDDVIFNTEPVVQKILEKIDYRATKKYRERISHRSSEDTRELLEESFNILDAILEETEYVEYDEEKEKTTRRSYKQINYDDIYKEKNLMPNAVEFVNRILNERGENDFIIFLSHMNPEREGLKKTQILYKLFPEVDAVETLPFHIEHGSKNINSKALWIKQLYGLETLDNCYLIDNSRSNCKDFRKHGGNFVRFLPDGFEEESTLADHMSRLVELDPYMLQFSMSFINYCRNNIDYLEEVDIPMDKVKKI
ncbi:MAG: hypothetical protein IJ068_04030 [Bacilli bacterium]|nr:hypothetical protein [Bacilli bacterium]